MTTIDPTAKSEPHPRGEQLLAQWKAMWDELRRREREEKIPALRARIIALDAELTAARDELAVLERDTAAHRT